ncbi:MAG: TVP38/TMEM64 family protein [Caldilineaceae bacterium]|nr:TVP38/TMEM64 family protein [Caldilineaceae bacterium]MBP8108025.1 TVP38/TMEM64 family protein [Caldilineaceae bacterium]MBP8125061.1 TVP38/TMEM64 family protein [Caldilineaceae bacterium]MBP9070998.1 TVP38/TMEM64 family protein [Caldilineaceae bacterium]
MTIPPPQSDPRVRPPEARRQLLIRLAFLAGLVVVGGILAWRYGLQMVALARDEVALEAFVAGLGWWGPLFLVTLNAIQIVVAPIPGYAAQLAAGFLFGPLWGGIWGSVGLLAGSMLAMLLTRIFGRPLAEFMVGGDRLARWEQTTHSDNPFVWAIVLFAPTGDLPFFMAGLAKVSFLKIALLTVITRVPTTFLVAAMGAGVTVISWWQFAVLFVLFMAVLLLFHRYQDPLQAWFDRQTQRFV